MTDNPSLDPNVDPRLLDLAKNLRERTDLSVEVDDGTILVGDVPNCMTAEVDDEKKVILSFHLGCHPQLVVEMLLVSLTSVQPEDLVISNCFLAEEDGMLVYEDEVGFELSAMNFYKEIIALHQPKIFLA